RERGRLAGRPAGDQRIGATGHVELDQLTDLGFVDLAVAEGRDQRDQGSGKRVAHGVFSRGVGGDGVRSSERVMWSMCASSLTISLVTLASGFREVKARRPLTAA